MSDPNMPDSNIRGPIESAPEALQQLPPPPSQSNRLKTFFPSTSNPIHERRNRALRGAKAL